jgi:hypothetical protein
MNFSAEAFEQSTSYTPLPAGTYSATVFKVDLVQVKSGENAGKDQYNVQFRVTEGNFQGRAVFTYIPLYAGKAQWKTLAFFNALGFEPKPGEAFSIPTPNDLSGRPIAVKVKVVAGMNGEENNISGFASTVSSTAVNNLASTLGATPVTNPSDLWA